MGMPTKPRGNGSAATQATTTQAETREAGNAARDEAIRRRAYQIYLESGEQPGRALDDWLQAERELETGALSHAPAS
jgi:Protein of unknown function (DUF2934)